MIQFEQLEGPKGIPVFCQDMTGTVGFVSMSWVMFTGAADDESIGLPGLYHWFEHVPFRGTKKYPSGAKDIQGPFVRYGGNLGAFTSHGATVFHATVPSVVWREALSTITDLCFAPLITDDGVEAERSVIVQEICRKKSALNPFVEYTLPGILFNKTPFGHPVLGTEESLTAMNADMVRQAFRLGYGAERALFVCAGAAHPKLVRAELETLGDVIVRAGISTRRSRESYNVIPERCAGKRITVQTPFPSSLTAMFYPLRFCAEPSFRWWAVTAFADALFDRGGMSSPLYRILRSERKLVYAAHSSVRRLPSGSGFLGIVAESERENIEPLLAAYRAVFDDAELRSRERFNEVRDSLKYDIDMRPADPVSYRKIAESDCMVNGYPVSSSLVRETLDSITMEEVHAHVPAFDPLNALTVVYEGMGT